jgi:hypothetical protein
VCGGQGWCTLSPGACLPACLPAPQPHRQVVQAVAGRYLWQELQGVVIQVEHAVGREGRGEKEGNVV